MLHLKRVLTALQLLPKKKMIWSLHMTAAKPHTSSNIHVQSSFVASSVVGVWFLRCSAMHGGECAAIPGVQRVMLWSPGSKAGRCWLSRGSLSLPPVFPPRGPARSSVLPSSLLCLTSPQLSSGWGDVGSEQLLGFLLGVSGYDLGEQKPVDPLHSVRVYNHRLWSPVYGNSC